MLRKAMDGIGCNEALVNEVFCTTTNAEIQEMKKSFEDSGDSALVDRLRSELKGIHETIIIQLMTKGRETNTVADEAKARGQAAELVNVIKSGSSMMGGLNSSAENRVAEIIRQSSVAQCQALKVITNRI
jgi:hypothetical protein